MKKSIIIALLAAFGISQMQAQVTFKPGIRGGVNFSNITESNGDYKPDFYIGGLMEIKLTKHYSLQPEISYTRQGANNVFVDYYDYANDITISGKQDVNINYLSLTGMNKFNIVEGFHVMVGPSLDILLSDNTHNNADGYSEDEDSNIDFAINAGFGYSFPSGLGFEFRFKKGIADVLDSSYYESGNGFLFGDYNTNILFQLGLTYNFDVKKKK